jgi:hypothetical protein
MIRHIVLWKFGTEVTAEQKPAIRQEMKKRLLELKTKVPVLKSISVSFNNEKASSANYDVMLDSEFASIEDLMIYQGHPAHVEVAEYIKSLQLQRAVIDFEQ